MLLDAGGAGGGALGRDGGDMGELFHEHLVMEARHGRIRAEEAGEHEGRMSIPLGAAVGASGVEEVVGLVGQAVIEPADGEQGDVPPALHVGHALDLVGEHPQVRIEAEERRSYVHGVLGVRVHGTKKK